MSTASPQKTAISNVWMLTREYDGLAGAGGVKDVARQLAEALARPGAWLPVTGLLLALLVAAAIYMVQERLAQLAWRNQTLQVEIMGRERAERVLRLGNRIAEIFLTGPDEVVYAEVVTLLLEEHRREVSEQARQYLTRIREGAHRMGVLVDDLLNLARVGRTE